MAITVEGTVVQNTFNNPATVATVNITTSGVDRVIVLQITTCYSSATAVTSVTASGLTFARRSTLTVNDGGGIQTQEVWWAYAAAQQTANTITVNHDLSQTCAVIGFAVAGLGNPTAPWDSNVSLPATASNIGGGATPSVSGVSTDTANALLLEFVATRQGTGPAAGTGFTTIGPCNVEPGPGSNRSYEVTGYKVVSATQSGATVSGGNSLTPWGIIADALADTPPLGWFSFETADGFHAVGYPSGAGVLGFFTPTETKDAFSAAGYTSASGPLTTFEGADQFSAYLMQPLRGTWASVGAPDVMHATGIGLGEDGVFITIEAVDTMAVVGNTPISGSFDATELADRFAAFGVGVGRVRRRRTFFVT